MNPKTMHALKPGQTLWDQGTRGAVKGLHLRAFPGKKVFYLYYRTRGGIQRRPKIAEYGSIDLAGARMIAQKMLFEVAQGGDPSQDTQDLRSEMTVGALFELTYQKHWLKKRRTTPSKHAYEVSRIYNAHIAPFFAGVKISTLTATMVREWHGHFEHCPYAGNRALETLSKIMNFAEEQELKSQNTNPCALVKPFMERSRERYATHDELRAIDVVLRGEWSRHPEEVAFIYLLMFTGARPSAIGRAQWADLDGYGRLTLDGKTGRETVQLPVQAMEVLRKLTIVWEGKKPTTLTGIKFPRAFWEHVRREARCEDLWARDLRRTFATVGMSAGLEISSISELLSHKSTQTTKIYAKLDPKNKEAAANITGEALEKILKSPRSHK